MGVRRGTAAKQELEAVACVRRQKCKLARKLVYCALTCSVATL